MTYLSRLILNPRDRDARRDLADVHELHRTVMRAFPQADVAPAREQYRVLFRAEVQRDGVPLLLVQSAAEPDWSHHPTGYLQAPPITKQIDQSYAALEAGQTLHFRLRANPTRRLSLRNDPDSKRSTGPRVDIRDEAQQFDWLRRKGQDSGFELLEVRLRPGVPAVDARSGGTVTGRRGGSGQRQNLSFGAVVFEGMLLVTDAPLFRQTLSTGIGSGKAYGFGLLSVAPIGSLTSAR